MNLVDRFVRFKEKYEHELNTFFTCVELLDAGTDAIYIVPLIIKYVSILYFFK